MLLPDLFVNGAANALNALHQYDKNNDRTVHYDIVIILIAIYQSHAAKPATANNPSHCRGTKNIDDGKNQPRHNGGQRLNNNNLEDDLQVGKAKSVGARAKVTHLRA